MKIKLSSSFLLAVLLFVPLGAASADAPTAIISAGSGSGNPGDTNISIPVTLNSLDGANVAGLNFDLSFDDSRLDLSDVSIGSAASSVGKTISWQPSSSTVRVIIFGLNQDAIPNGTVANVIFNVLVGAASGTSPLTLSNAAATDPSGSGIGVNLNNGSFTVLSPPATNTPTSAPTDTPLPTSTLTPTIAPTDTPVPTSSFTPTIAPTDPPIVTSTSTTTVAPTSSTTPTMTPSIGPSPTGGPSTTPTQTKTGAPSASATSEPKTTSSVTPTPNLTVSPEVTTSPTEGGTASPIPTLNSGITTDPTLNADATSTALAEVEAAVAATSTALAAIGQEPTKGVKPISGLSDWLGQWGDILLVGGAALSTTLVMTGLLFKVLKPKVYKNSRKRIY